MRLNDEKKILKLLESFTKGYGAEVPMSLYNYVLPLYCYEGVDYPSCTHLGALLRGFIKQDHHFMETFGKDYKSYESLISKALSMAFIHKTMHFDVHDGDLYASFVEMGEDDDLKAYALGTLFKGYDEIGIRELLARCVSRIVFLQTKSLGEDMDLSRFSDFCDITYYDYMDQEHLLEAIKQANIVITNKNLFTKEIIDACPSLKLICLTATGTNNVDLAYAKEKGIKVCNVSGYSTDAVAQLTIGMALDLNLHIHDYDTYVKSGQYAKDGQFSYFKLPFHSFSHLTWGIVGLGHIGRKVASVATALGAQVVYTSVSGVKRHESYPCLDFDHLLEISDIISIHCPLTEKTRHLFDEDAFEKMKSSAILINVARGPIVDEEALAKALNGNQLMGAGLDVFETEPLPLNSPLYQADPHKLLLSPHAGWASVEARSLLCDEVYENITAYMDGIDRNIVNN
ncbi:MAG: NAD(P)-dependent oxidoreductase [Intestinibaculum porci]|uniref:NAD(P)-dependent oxidoreductase n=1 Tax=Intestinibaculum porci TaxID=2487118 RepID=UPI00240942B7|nr:NAD(P)-dependent oxidoreductase [Intestinibaculum porci]MDD6423452.1 NAD(P)-dependent oxidoreductase [Intestinibaculum porci]